MCNLAEALNGSDQETCDALAEELHDGPLQDLAAIKLNLGTMAQLADLSPEELKEKLVALKALTESVIEDLNGIIRTLAVRQADSVDGRGEVDLFVRLSDLCADFRAETGITCRFAVWPEHLRFAKPTSEVLFRAVRELLTNVRKHARATQVDLTSELKLDGSVVLSLSDNGIGMPMLQRRGSPVENGGFGLWSIDRRLEEFGGSLEIFGDSGYQARITVPKHAVLAMSRA